MQQLKDPMLSSGSANIVVVVDYVRSLREQFSELLKRADKLSEYQQILKASVQDYDDLEPTQTQLDNYWR